MMDRDWGDWILTPQRVAVHRATRTGVVADLHLGYHAARRFSGDAVPTPSLETELRPLLQVCERLGLESIAVAGDLFEKAFDAILWKRLHELVNVRVSLVPGNHDRRLTDVPTFPDGVRVGDWLVVHGDRPRPEGPTVCGHFHPSVRRRGRKAPCYLMGAGLLVLPAYSAEAAGVDIRGVEQWRSMESYVIGD